MSENKPRRVTDHIDALHGVSDDGEKYRERYTKLAERNLNAVSVKGVAAAYGHSEELGVWHIPTQLDSYPDMLNLTRKLLPNRVFESGLDIGCGTVSFFSFLPCRRQILLDLALPYCYFMRDLGFLSVQADAESLPVRSASLDLVVCSDVLEHVLSFDSALSEIRRVMQSDGILLVNVPWDEPESQLRDLCHLRRFTNENICNRFPGFDLLGRSEPKSSNPNWLPKMNMVFRLSNKEGSCAPTP